MHQLIQEVGGQVQGSYALKQAVPCCYAFWNLWPLSICIHSLCIMKCVAYKHNHGYMYKWHICVSMYMCSIYTYMCVKELCHVSSADV